MIYAGKRQAIDAYFGTKKVLNMYLGDVGVYSAQMSVDCTFDGVASNAPENVKWGESLTVTLSADSGTQLASSSVVVTMGGVDVTSQAYSSSTNKITISNVTGDISIAAAATIVFADSNVKNICVTNWGGSVVSGEITKNEAAAVTSLGGKFRGNTTITKFNELRYFTGLTSLYISGNSTASQGEFYGCSNMTEIQLPHVAMTNISGAFRNMSKMTEIDLSPLTATGNMNGTFHNIAALTKVTLPGVDLGSSWAYTFRACANLITIEIDGTADLSKVTTFNTPFYACSKLSTITGAITGISVNLSLSDCSALTRDSLLVILNGLADMTGKTGKTLTLHATAKARLTADDLAIAAGKNWTVS